LISSFQMREGLLVLQEHLKCRAFTLSRQSPATHCEIWTSAGGRWACGWSSGRSTSARLLRRRDRSARRDPHIPGRIFSNNASFRCFFARGLRRKETTTHYLRSRVLPRTRKRVFEKWTAILSDGSLFRRIIGLSGPSRRLPGHRRNRSFLCRSCAAKIGLGQGLAERRGL
jgi:hypothetical protein